MNISLNSYLHRMKVQDVDSLNCMCMMSKKNVDHVLLHCPRYASLREDTP